MNKSQYAVSRLPYKIKTQYVHLVSITDTSIKHAIPVQFTPVLNSCIYTCLIDYILPLVMKENLSSALFGRISPREKEVACN